MCRLVETHRNNTVNFIYIAPLKAEFTKCSDRQAQAEQDKIKIKERDGRTTKMVRGIT